MLYWSNLGVTEYKLSSVSTGVCLGFFGHFNGSQVMRSKKPAIDQILYCFSCFTSLQLHNNCFNTVANIPASHDG